MNTFEKIYSIVRRIPSGKVATYGQIALMAGNPRLSRVVGYALHRNPSPETIPCFRVVNRFGECPGSFAFGGEDAQRLLLEEDGVLFIGNRVDMKKCQWTGEII
ncbi:MAG: MGMT family protein [Ruminococcaceae bacterium]|nr:MGMT family protein [Oscillospiraceae bacterium]